MSVAFTTLLQHSESPIFSSQSPRPVTYKVLRLSTCGALDLYIVAKYGASESENEANADRGMALQATGCICTLSTREVAWRIQPNVEPGVRCHLLVGRLACKWRVGMRPVKTCMPSDEAKSRAC